MDGERWQTLQDLFAQAMAQPGPQRAAFVASRCSGDAALAHELRRLLDGAAAIATAADPVQAAIVRAAAGWAASQHDARAGERLGPWRIVSHIADGGMGAVYLGERADGRYVQRVAIKLLNPARVGPEHRARLAQERQILARLQHPHIARLLDGGETAAGVPYLVMEHVDGLPIDAWCHERAADVPTRVRLVALVARAVDHAHRNLVVHRDLKPGNILVDAAGAPHLLDFGIAKLVDADAGLTASQERPLTPSHASPEQITGAAITTATDVYALGVLLYQLLAGRHPQHEAAATNPAALARAIVDLEPPRPSQAAQAAGRPARELRGDLDRIVLAALRKEPQRRYAGAAALADDLERHLAHLPVHARRDTPAYRAAKLARRHPVAVPATALAVVAALATGSYFAWRLAAERDAALQAQAASRQTTGFLLDVFAAADPFASSGQALGVPELLRRGVERVDQELAGQPAVRARLLHSLGTVHMGRGEFREAEPLLRRALQAAQPLGQQADIAEFTESLGVVVGLMARHDEARPLLEEAVALRRRAAVRDDAGLSSALYRLAWLRLEREGRAAAAMPLLDEALELLRGLGEGDSREASVILNATGVARRRLGDWTGAITAYREVVAVNERAGRPHDAIVGTAQMNIGVALHSHGRGAEAEPHYLAALAHGRAQPAGGNRWAAEPVLANLGKLYVELGRLQEAEPLLEEALSLAREQLGDAHPFVASDTVLLAALRRAQGRHAESLQLLDSALAVYAAAEGFDRSHVLAAQWQKAWTLIDAGQPALALPLLDAVLDAYGERPQWGARGMAAQARSLRGAALVALGDTAAGLQLLREAEAALRDDPDAAPHMKRDAAARLAAALP